MNPTLLHPSLRWDIFCRVIDNFGDIGVAWRLAVNLAQRGQTVRLWANDVSALDWLAPESVPDVQVLPWNTPLDMNDITPGDVLIEAFGCEIAPEFIAAYARHINVRSQHSHWINLEYLSAENYAERCHGLPSPVMSGPGKGLVKHFFYPGFGPGTGGLLRETDLLERQARFDRTAWLAQQQIDGLAGVKVPDELGAQPLGRQVSRLVSLFCYEPASLGQLLDDLASDITPTLLLVTAGRSTQAVQRALHDEIGLQTNTNKRKSLSISYLPHLSQREFDHLLWACDLNFVRGEDSLVRALWAGRPFIWQIYPQDDGAHRVKLEAFLDWLQAPPSLRLAYHLWNGIAAFKPNQAFLTSERVAQWQATFMQARQALLEQEDLGSQLLNFVSKTH